MSEAQKDNQDSKESEELSFTLGDDEIRDIVEAVHEQDSDTVNEALNNLSPG